VKTIPEGVQLTSIKQEGSTLTLQGVAQSNARVSTYMRNFEQSEWLSSPDLAIIEARAPAATAAAGAPTKTQRQASNRLDFSLRVLLKSKTRAEDEAADGEVVPGATP